MPEQPALNVLAVVGSMQSDSVNRVVIGHLVTLMTSPDCAIDLLDLQKEPLDLYNPDTAYEHPGFPKLKARVETADVFLLGTPDYHGSIGSAMKNFLDHFWREFAGKLFVPIVASHEKGLTVIDQLRTVARQCYAWVMPYGISCAENADLKDGKVVSDSLEQRLAMVARDAVVYGNLLARQRRADLDCADICFMARHRKGKRVG